MTIVNGDDDETSHFIYDAAIGLQPSVNRVLAAMFATDEDFIHLFKSAQGKHEGWIRFVYGNDGFDVISDYTTNLEDVLQPVNAYADTFDSI